MVLTRRDLRVKETAARIALQKAQTLQARWKVLHDKKLISDQQLENVRFDAEVAHCNWVTAQYGTGQNRNHRAPGRNGGRGQCKAVGDWILAYTAVARVIDHMDLEVHLLVPEDMLNAIHKNMPLSAVPTAGGKRALPGRVIGISPVIDPDSGTCKVTGLFLNAGKYVRPWCPGRCDHHNTRCAFKREESIMAYILVVDDDPDIRDLARDTLRDAGHCPILAPDVFRALDVLNHQEPDLVLTALEFPDLDGYGLTRAIRKYHPDTACYCPRLIDQRIPKFNGTSIHSTI